MFIIKSKFFNFLDANCIQMGTSGPVSGAERK